jgi:amino acid permease
MIAIGGSIGSGLFIGSGGALATGGPGWLLAGFMMIGFLMYWTTQALAEMAVMFPVKGAFSAYSTRFISPAWGFAMGWNYAMQVNTTFNSNSVDYLESVGKSTSFYLSYQIFFDVSYFYHNSNLLETQVTTLTIL